MSSIIQPLQTKQDNEIQKLPVVDRLDSIIMISGDSEKLRMAEGPIPNVTPCGSENENMMIVVA